MEGVVVADLKALGTATGMGGSSSEADYHCIYNEVHRQNKGQGKGTKCSRCEILGKFECNHYSVFPTSQREVIKGWDKNHPDLKYQFIVPKLGSSHEDKLDFLKKSGIHNMAALSKEKPSQLLSLIRNDVDAFFITPHNLCIENSKCGDINAKIDWGLKVRGVENNEDINVAYLLAVEKLCIDVASIDSAKPESYKLFLKKKNILLFLMDYGDQISYSRQAIGKTNIYISDVEICCPDLLHMDLRIGLNLLAKIIQEIPNMQGNNARGMSHATLLKFKDVEEKLQEILTTNKILKIKYDGTSVKPFTLDGSELKTIMQETEFQKLIDLIFLNISNTKFLERKRKWEELIVNWNATLTLLHCRDDIEDSHKEEVIGAIQDTIDIFCYNFRDLFGAERITNYIWILMSGK